MYHLQITSLLHCRLCRQEVKDNHISIPTEAQCPRVKIIQQHYGIEVIWPDHPEVLVCQQCWATTEQFHLLLFTTVQHHESFLARQALDLKFFDVQNSPADVSIFNCKVEILDDDNHFAEEPDSKPASRPSTPLSTSDWDPLTEDRDKQPPKKRVKTTKSTPVAAGRRQTKFTSAEIDEQNDRVREFFQMRCDLCATEFELMHDAIKHYREEHGQPGYLKCCGKKFFKRGLVLDHIRFHADPNAFHCASCSRSYISQVALKMHMTIRHHNQPLSKPLKCVVCALEFVKQFQLMQHQRQVHAVNTHKSFGCDICGKL